MAFYRDEVLADSPYFYFNYDNDNLTTNSGSQTGATVVSSGGFAFGAGKVGRAPDFTGPATAARVNYNLGSNAVLNTANWTIEMWFRVDAFSAGFMDLFQINDGSNLITAFFDFGASKALKIRHKAQAGTLYTITTTHTQNTSWHHLALVRNGTTLTAYVDNVSVGSSTIAATNPTFGSGTSFFLGSYGDSAANENMDGAIDEVAIYPTSLSTTRIGAHYAADTTKTNIAPTPLTATALIVSPAVSAAKSINYAPTPATASATSPGGLVYLDGQHTDIAQATADTWIVSGSSTTHGSSTTADFARSNTTLLFQFAATDNAATGTKAVLRLYNTTGFQIFGYAPTVYKITSAWSEATASGTNAPSMTLVATLPARDIPAGTYFDIDVSDWYTQNTQGLAIGGTGVASSVTTAERENATSAQRPQLLVSSFLPDRTLYAPALTANADIVSPSISVTVSRTVTTTALTATALMTAAMVSGSEEGVASALLASAVMMPATVTGSAGVSPTALTAAATLVNPAVTVESHPDANFNATPLTASAAMAGGVFASPVNLAVSPITASAAMANPSASTEKNGLVFATPMTASARLSPPLEAQVETEDPYFNRVKNQLGSNYDMWYRMDEVGSLTTAITHAPSTAPNGQYVGNPTSDLTGPIGRRAVQFDGADDSINLPDFTDNGVTSGVFEFTIKTAKPTQNIIYGSDRVINLNETNLFMDSIGTINGKIRLTIGATLGSAASFNAPVDFVGNTVVTDNEWHHIVLVFDAARVSVYVDGKLDFARRLTERQHFIAIPDWIGGGSFQGEMMEFIFRAAHTISADDVLRNYYAVQGWIPNYAEPMTAVASAPKAKGKGNGKRALALYYNGNDGTKDFFDTESHYMWTELTGHVNPAGGEAAVFDMGEFKVFPKNVLRSHVNTDEYLGGDYYDVVTGEPRYIDLTTDVDTTDYDMVFFIDLPPRLDPYGSGEKNNAYYTMVEKVREAQDQTGFSLWVPQPELAQDLGIIQEVTVHGMEREVRTSAIQGNAINFYDYRSAVVDPWRSVSDADTNAYFYWDMHALNRYRVNAVVEGLTTLNGYIDADFFLYRPRDPFGLDIKAWKYRELTDGLHIGDEFLYGSQDFYAEASGAGGNFARQYDRFTVVAVKPNHVKAGTIVTTENATHWVGSSQVTNPYKDYATTIILQPGDNLAGHPVNGRIFVNFMEGAVALGWTTLAKQVVPADESISDPRDKENAARRAWDYSTYRQTTTGVTGTITNQVQQAGENTQVNPVQGGSTIVGVNVAEKYPVVSVRRYGMVERGLHWLADRVLRQAGDVVIRVAPMAASVTTGQAQVRADKDTVYSAQASLANAQLVKPSSVHEPDVTVQALPMTVDAKLIAPSRVIKAEPMAVSVAMVQPVSETIGEQVVLYLDTHDATLFILEEA